VWKLKKCGGFTICQSADRRVWKLSEGVITRAFSLQPAAEETRRFVVNSKRCRGAAEFTPFRIRSGALGFFQFAGEQGYKPACGRIV